MQQWLAPGQIDLSLKTFCPDVFLILIQRFHHPGIGHHTVAVLLITVDAAQIAFVRDMPLQIMPVHTQSAPPPPQLEHEEQLEQEEPPEEDEVCAA